MGTMLKCIGGWLTCGNHKTHPGEVIIFLVTIRCENWKLLLIFSSFSLVSVNMCICNEGRINQRLNWTSLQSCLFLFPTRTSHMHYSVAYSTAGDVACLPKPMDEWMTMFINQDSNEITAQLLSVIFYLKIQRLSFKHMYNPGNMLSTNWTVWDLLAAVCTSDHVTTLE